MTAQPQANGPSVATIDPALSPRWCAAMLGAAYNAALASRDHSTQVGAVLCTPAGTVLEAGWNRLPSGVAGRPERFERPAKYVFTEHAERDVIYAASRRGVLTLGTVLVCPWAACGDCARAVIAAGIACLVRHGPALDAGGERWRESVAVGDVMLAEAGVPVVTHPDPIGAAAVRLDGAPFLP